MLPGRKLGPSLPVHPKHLQSSIPIKRNSIKHSHSTHLNELCVSQELLPFPRVNIFRQLVYTWQGEFAKRKKRWVVGTWREEKWKKPAERKKRWVGKPEERIA